MSHCFYNNLINIVLRKCKIIIKLLLMKFSFSIVFILLLSIKLHAQWNSNTTVNTPVCVAQKSQQNIHAVTDTKGGCIIAWDDNRNSATNATDIYAQRLNADGIAKWTADGISVCNNTLNQGGVSIAEDGVGGAIVTWHDNRSGNYDIYAQRIDSLGNAVWAANGVVICNKSTDQKGARIVSDNAGGAIIVWEDSINNYWDIYAQKITANGTVAWASNGIAICKAANTQINPRIDIDGAGGAIITRSEEHHV